MPSRDRLLVWLVLLGLILRLPGTLFNGMADLFQILLDWGLGVWHQGLGPTFGINYGVLSYAVFGVTAGLGELIPRFWWAPYKLAVIASEAVLLVALLGLVPPARRRLALVLYWLNPWFILHGAWHGFWEAPYLLFGLLAVYSLGGRDEASARRWALAGAALAVSGMFKPQGLVYFAAPVTMYLALQFLQGARSPLRAFLAGWGSVLLATAVALRAAGGSWLALVDNYASAFTVMGGITNGGPGIWRFLAFVYMNAMGISGPVHSLHLPRLALGALSALAGLVCLAILALFAFKVRLPRRSAAARPLALISRLQRLAGEFVAIRPERATFLVITLGALVFAQFGARAHINHSYGVLVLLVPLVVDRPRALRVWVVMCAILGLAHLVTFRLGGVPFLPPEYIWDRYPAADQLIARVQALPAHTHPDALLAFQARVNGWLEWPPGQAAISILSIVVFVCACVMVKEIFAAASSEPRADRP